jgi:hypothetical protein
MKIKIKIMKLSYFLSSLENKTIFGKFIIR